MKSKSIKDILSASELKKIRSNKYNYLDKFPDLYEKLFNYFSSTKEMPYGVQKARTGDPYDWLYKRVDKELSKKESFNKIDEFKDKLISIKSIYEGMSAYIPIYNLGSELNLKTTNTAFGYKFTVLPNSKEKDCRKIAKMLIRRLDGRPYEVGTEAVKSLNIDIESSTDTCTVQYIRSTRSARLL